MEHLFRYPAQFEGNLLRFVRARAHVRLLLTRKSGAVGMRNAILRNYLKRVFLVRKSTVVVFFYPFVWECAYPNGKKLLNLGLFAKFYKQEVDSINENEMFSYDRVQY